MSSVDTNKLSHLISTGWFKCHIKVFLPVSGKDGDVSVLHPISAVFHRLPLQHYRLLISNPCREELIRSHCWLTGLITFRAHWLCLILGSVSKCQTCPCRLSLYLKTKAGRDFALRVPQRLNCKAEDFRHADIFPLSVMSQCLLDKK